ncbi:MAG: helix-turn-helix transcriptional regulator [Pseudomonadota bacterium]
MDAWGVPVTAFLIAPTVLQSTAFAGLLLVGRASTRAERTLACLFAIHALSVALQLAPETGDNHLAASLVAISLLLAFLYGPLTLAYVFAVLPKPHEGPCRWQCPGTWFAVGVAFGLPLAVAIQWGPALSSPPLAIALTVLAALVFPAYLLINAITLFCAGRRTLRSAAAKGAAGRDVMLARRIVAIVTLGWLVGLVADLPATSLFGFGVYHGFAACTELLCALGVGLLALHHRSDAPKASASYARSVLTDAEAARLKRKLEGLMRAERAYRDPDLSLARLAERIGCPPHKLTHLLATRLRCGYSEYVNSWRITEACELLLDTKETVLAISLGVGFNSRSTFNAAFKAQTGTTPSAYRAHRRSEVLH